MKKRKWVPWVIGLAALIAVLACVYQSQRPSVSEGDKKVELVVTDSEGNAKKYEAQTDAEVLSDLLDQLQEEGDFSYEASSSEYGMYIVSVNGEEADYGRDQAYWAIYVNGEYGSYGADSQPVRDGDCFELRYEKAE